uniref:Peptidase A2 domain-containing protein n=1 Tax=Panagrolaimus superbus TaxID=310955 RepID=A0A914Z206_9BILA
MVRLYDRAESVFAKRYAAFNMDWKGPENESPAAYAARVREQVGAMDVANFDGVAAETMYCASCGGNHYRKDCKFKDAVCRFCSNIGHIEAVCRKKAASKPQSSNGNSANQCSKPRVSVNSTYIQKVSQPVPFAADKRHMVEIGINDVTITAQLDNGADVTIMSDHDYQRIGCPTLTGKAITALMANGYQLKIRGSFRAMVTLKGHAAHVKIHVADIPTTLLGINFFESFRITLAFATSGHSVLHQFESNSNLFKEVPANHRDSLKKGKKHFSPCFTCGDKHRRSSCKLCNAQCHFCQKIGHIEKVCRKKHNNRRSFFDCSDSDAALQSSEPSRRPNVKTLRFAEPATGYSNGDLCINTVRVSDPPHAARASSSEVGHHSHRTPTRTISLATNPTVASVAVDPYPANTYHE